MKSLRARIVILTALVALVTALVCCLVADAVTSSPHHPARDGDHTAAIIAVSGLGAAVLASMLGGLLGWWWLRPIEQLANACRKMEDDEAAPLAQYSGLREVDQLAVAFNQRLATERQARQRLTEAHDREATAHAVQRRFLAHLGQELGQPLRRIIDLTADAESATMAAAPERLVELSQCARTLEERFQELLGLADDAGINEGTGKIQSTERFLRGIADQFQAQTQARHLTITVVAPDDAACIPVRLLTPVLVNLVANALRATTAGGVTLIARRGERHWEWMVSDTGPGLSPELAERIADCCRRGEVMPGTAGIGLGLTLALAHLRNLHGRLELAANSAQGATFRVTLPFADQA